MQDSILHRHMWPELDKLRCHNAAGGILRIFENVVDHLSLFRIGGHQDTFDYVGWHFFDQICRIIDIQFVNDFLQFVIGKTPDQHFLCIRFHLYKRIGSQLLGEQAVKQRYHLVIHVLEE